jgi:hypothetical protein
MNYKDTWIAISNFVCRESFVCLLQTNSRIHNYLQGQLLTSICWDWDLVWHLPARFARTRHLRNYCAQSKVTLPPNLQTLQFPAYASAKLQSIELPLLPRGLTYLHCGWWSGVLKQQDLPTSLTRLHCGRARCEPCFPTSLIRLHCGYGGIALAPGDLPSGLTRLSCRLLSAVQQDVDVLPSSLLSLRCRGCVRLLGVLPQNLTRLYCGYLPDHTHGSVFCTAALHSLVELHCGAWFNCAFLVGWLPASLRTLYCGSSYNKVIEPGVLPTRLTSLHCGESYNKVIEPGVLPTRLTSLHCGSFYS